MPIEIKKLDNGLGCLIKAEGELSNEEIFSPIFEHLYKPREEHEKYIYLISDYTNAVITDVDLNYIYKIAQKSMEVSKLNSNLVVSITANDDITFGLVNIWGLLVRECGWKIKIFRKRQLADKWLNKEMNKRYDLTRLRFN